MNQTINVRIKTQNLFTQIIPKKISIKRILEQLQIDLSPVLRKKERNLLNNECAKYYLDLQQEFDLESFETTTNHYHT